MRASLSQCSTDIAALVEENTGLQNRVNELEALLSNAPQPPQNSSAQANQVKLSLTPIRGTELNREESNIGWTIALVLIAVVAGIVMGLMLAVTAYRQERNRQANSIPIIYQNRLIG